MAVNVKAKYKNIPNQTIGPFTATLEYFESSGITISGVSVTGVTITTNDIGEPTQTATGIIETLNIGPFYTILKDNLTHEQLISGYTFNQIKCGDTFITFQSTDVCYSSYIANLVGSNGYPTVRLTVNNDTSLNISSTLTVTSISGATAPSTSSITVSSSSPGSIYDEISLGKGKYNFTFDITSDNPHNDPDRNVVLTFIDCGSL